MEKVKPPVTVKSCVITLLVLWCLLPLMISTSLILLMDVCVCLSCLKFSKFFRLLTLQTSLMCDEVQHYCYGCTTDNFIEESTYFPKSRSHLKFWVLERWRKLSSIPLSTYTAGVTCDPHFYLAHFACCIGTDTCVCLGRVRLEIEERESCNNYTENVTHHSM